MYPDMSLSSSCWTGSWPIRIILHSLFTHLAPLLNSKLSACSRPLRPLPACSPQLTHVLQSRLRKLACVKPLFSVTCNFPKQFPSGFLLFLPRVSPKVLWAPPVLPEGHSEKMSRRVQGRAKIQLSLEKHAGLSPLLFPFHFSHPSHLLFPLQGESCQAPRWVAWKEEFQSEERT